MWKWSPVYRFHFRWQRFFWMRFARKRAVKPQPATYVKTKVLIDIEFCAIRTDFRDVQQKCSSSSLKTVVTWIMATNRGPLTRPRSRTSVSNVKFQTRQQFVPTQLPADGTNSVSSIPVIRNSNHAAMNHETTQVSHARIGREIMIINRTNRPRCFIGWRRKLYYFVIRLVIAGEFSIADVKFSGRHVRVWSVLQGISGEATREFALDILI